jgi:hypothetical protein
VTHHRLPTDAVPTVNTSLRVGFYLPETEVRLPLSVAGTAAGDAFTIAVRQ